MLAPQTDRTLIMVSPSGRQCPPDGRSMTTTSDKGTAGETGSGVAEERDVVTGLADLGRNDPVSHEDGEDLAAEAQAED